MDRRWSWLCGKHCWNTFCTLINLLKIEVYQPVNIHSIISTVDINYNTMYIYPTYATVHGNPSELRHTKIFQVKS